ncbi:outer membrane beta-barrel protein [Lacinutrix salivirga]
MQSQLKYYCFLFLFLISIKGVSQSETSEWKALFAVGINSPSQDGFVDVFEAKGMNFPTINLGVQHMFKPQLGAKLDFGYNRFQNEDNTPEFKINYTRINVQFVYDLTPDATFLPTQMGLVAHLGPGYSMVKPLGDYKDNKVSFLNAMAGLELHYKVGRTTSVFLDASYILGFGDEFDPITEGFGSFNGNLFTATIGVSVSLSGCYFCN